MNGPSQSGQLVWLELLSPKEIEDWAVSRKQPRKLWRVGGISRPGVYRFVFPEDRSCYIGVAGHFGTRLRDHICARINQDSEGYTKVGYGWSVRGAIQNSLGQCYLQQLRIQGAVRICGVVLNQHSLDDLFARLLLENWVILHSERIEKLRPRNRDIPTGIQQDLKDDLRPAVGNIVKVGRHGMVIKRGGLESLL
jgi:hypothetical protein